MKMAMTHYATDIVFLIDATASMQPGFDDLKQAIVRFLESLEDPENTSRFLGPNFGPLLVDWRAAIYAYRDSKADGVKWFESRSFVRGVAAVKQQLAELRAEGGGTGPTDLVNALVRVSALDQIPREQEDEDSGKWRYRTKAIRQVFVLTDKACHMPSSISLEDLNSAIVDAGLRLWLFVPSGLSCYDDLNCIDKSEVLCYSTPFDENAIMPLTACFSDDCWRTYFFRNCRHDHDIQIGAPIDDPDYVAPFSTHHKSPPTPTQP